MSFSNYLLSQLEHGGCNGRMKLENGKIVFEIASPTPQQQYATPAPSAPPLAEDNRIIYDLRVELDETKGKLAVMEQQIQQLFKFREVVSIPVWWNPHTPPPRVTPESSTLYNFNVNTVRFIHWTYSNYAKCITSPQRPSYSILLGTSDVPLLPGTEKVDDILYVLQTQVRRDMMNNIVIQPHQTITPDCGAIIKFIIDWMKTSPNQIEITIMNLGATLAIGFVVALCERLNPDKLSKLKINTAKISEQTELRNKVDKTLFRKIEIENVMSSI
jgi:hypothetical protein